MMFDWVDELLEFFSQMGEWITFLSTLLGLLPPVFLTCISIMLIATIVFGGLYILLKLIG